MIKIMNLRRHKPSEKWDFVVDRTSPLGNPFFIQAEHDRNGACIYYEKWFDSLLQDVPREQERKNEAIKYLASLVAVYRLYGKLRLFCWCAPKRCHARTIKNYILGEEKGEDGES